MINRQKLYTRPNYLLAKYQQEIFRELSSFMEEKGLSQKDIAEKLGVSNAYVSQVLNGNFNFTLKKLIEIGILIGKIPRLEFIDVQRYLSGEFDSENEVRTLFQDSEGEIQAIEPSRVIPLYGSNEFRSFNEDVFQQTY